MTGADLTAVSPLSILIAASIFIMLSLAFYRSHTLTVILTLAGLACSALAVYWTSCLEARPATPLLILDPVARFSMLLVLFAGFIVAALSFSYLDRHRGHKEEFYLLLMIATLGCCVLSAANHFAAAFLGIELLSVSLYAMTAYFRHSSRGIEAGIKYLILAAVSSAITLFGMALVYAETGSMGIEALGVTAGRHGQLWLSGMAMVIVGLGFKLAVVPFHVWSPDVYEGAPAPVTAFIATASKSAVFILTLRLFVRTGIIAQTPIFLLFAATAIASMFAGNLLALLQSNVKRILAYSSISHLGYLLVTILATGTLALPAAAIYLAAYSITTLGAFGVVTVLSGPDRDADRMEDYQGLAWKRPWLAGTFIAMLLSLAGIPLTAGFIAKFTVIAAGVDSSLWFVIVAMIVNSVIGLFYYLKIIVALFAGQRLDENTTSLSRSGSAVLAVLVILLVWLGVYPGPMIETIKSIMIF